MTFETCSSCGIPFTDHAGIIGTCRELHEAKGRVKELETVLREVGTDIFRSNWTENPTAEKHFAAIQKALDPLHGADNGQGFTARQ